MGKKPQGHAGRDKQWDKQQGGEHFMPAGPVLPSCAYPTHLSRNTQSHKVLPARHTLDLGTDLRTLVDVLDPQAG
jgi:hypothetical protein